MSSSSFNITKNKVSGVPVMLAQAVVAALALCLGEALCSPVYVSLTREAVFPVLPWALVACLFAVAFSYVVGFAALWCCESFAYRMKPKVQPLAYAVIGAIAFGVWTRFVIVSIMDQICASVGVGAMESGSVTLATVNGAVLGLAAFFAASTLGERFSRHRAAVIAIGVATVVLAVAGAYVLACMAGAIG